MEITTKPHQWIANFVSCLDPLPAPGLFCRKSQTLYFTCTISVYISKRYVFKHNYFTIVMAPPSKNNPVATSTAQIMLSLPWVSCKWSHALSSLSGGDSNSPPTYHLTCLYVSPSGDCPLSLSWAICCCHHGGRALLLVELPTLCAVLTLFMTWSNSFFVHFLCISWNWQWGLEVWSYSSWFKAERHRALGHPLRY